MMKIERVLVHVVEVPGSQARTHQLIQVAGLNRVQYTHTSAPADGSTHLMVMRVQTDEGVEGICTFDGHGGDPRYVVQLVRNHVVGQDPFRREFLFQKLHQGTRWLYQRPGWFGTLDNCLWDITGKVAGLPIYALLGKNRDGVPAYLTAGDGPVEMYIEHIEQGRELGINAYKPHSYKGGKADIPIMVALREHVGPDYDLMLDPVCSYTLREAIEVGHVLEELDFVWLEEPFFEQKMDHYQELCAELVIPIMANETLMYDMNLSAQWLIQGATDRLRANARHGTTQVLKMAHMAELHGTTIELNGVGGIFGHVHAQLGCSIANNSYYEHTGGGRRMMEDGLKIGLLNPPEIIDGELVPADGPGWGAEWDLDKLESLTVEML
jgi:L-alanine-DL-glutamate epimerase-like enolase superfamily enzyme